ncbi:hypothetical protein FNV43_RR24622 [Rhamnella rubrinervis]|uniref:RNI-like superfamily protein n=1 Tax=Rhamnella rubrinervis TaxID=2594499 RepID=A0A8K0DM37_9ROSA|nr:hypothetical protein FNV43_RR24622 [Rhamnella rubrinervis]
MADPRNQDSYGNDKSDGVVERFVDQSDGQDFDDSSSSNSVEDPGAGSVSRGEIGLRERLTEILVDESDGDLLLQNNNREDRVLQWLQALDMQVMGACRSDERLKPLLKMNASNGVAEDSLLAHLSQHFEPVEVGMLARCFCIPLVSVRVGKINKQGTLLCPSAIRGNLNLTVLPTSDLRLSFIGDDGVNERICTLSSKSQCSSVAVNEIPEDDSGRSFLIKAPDGKDSYFWCSEKSKLLGIELLAKMKDLIMRRPSIAELTGISESRLGCFATQLRAYLVGSTLGVTSSSSVVSHKFVDASSDTAQDGQFASMSSKSLRSRHTGTQVVRTNSSFQGSLSPRSSSFKEGLPRNMSSLRTAAREKLRRRGDNHFSPVDNLGIASPVTTDSSLNNFENDKLPSCFLDSLGKLTAPPTVGPASQVSYIGAPLLSPYYCFCPPNVSSFQGSADTMKLPSSVIESPLLPPLASLLPATMPASLLAQTPPYNLLDSPSNHFPAFMPDPLVRFPRPTSQQIPTFTPLMCDPIVHIPVIDVCSSGQGYLVSAGPTLSSTIPPLHPNLVNPLIPKTDSVVEKNARETLRLLISGSSQTNLPAVLTNADESPSIFVTGSRGLYSGTRDVDVIASSIAAMGLVSLSGRSDGGSHDSNLNVQEEGSSVTGGESCSDDDGTFCSVVRKESIDQ